MRGIMKKSFLISISTLLFLSVTTMASAQWVTTQLTNNSDDEYSPQINDSGQVVWYGYDGTDDQIRQYSVHHRRPFWLGQNS
jgi:hypothetical protein